MEKNLDTILERTFDYAKKIAKDFYFNEWRPNPPHCPAFDGEVVNITREGWEHVVETIHRTKMDVLGRLFVLERAKKILEESATFQDYQEVTDQKQKIEYWIFYAVIEEVSIKVVIRSIGKGPKHFLSVIKKGTVRDDIEPKEK